MKNVDEVFETADLDEIVKSKSRFFESVNEYGVETAYYVCPHCLDYFGITPAPKSQEKEKQWATDGCLMSWCVSYDANRDVDALLFFGAAKLVKKDNNE